MMADRPIAAWLSASEPKRWPTRRAPRPASAPRRAARPGASRSSDRLVIQPSRPTVSLPSASTASQPWSIKSPNCSAICGDSKSASTSRTSCAAAANRRANVSASVVRPSPRLRPVRATTFRPNRRFGHELAGQMIQPTDGFARGASLKARPFEAIDIVSGPCGLRPEVSKLLGHL